MEDQVDLEVWTREHVMAWKREAADHRSRVLAHCKSCDYGPGVAAFIAQLENERWSMHGLGQIWQTASSWKGYCQLLAISAAILGNEPCLRVLHGLGGDAAASLAAANAGGMTLAHVAAGDGHEGCLRVLHELGGEAAASLAAADAGGWTPAHSAATYGHEGCLRVLHELGGEVAASLVAVDASTRPPTSPLTEGTRVACACCTSWVARWRPAWRQ